MNVNRLEKLKEWEMQQPDDAFLKFAIAQEYVSASDDDMAIVFFEILNKNFADYLPAYYQYGKLLERAGELEKARLVYTDGMKVAERNQDGKTYRELKEALTLLEDE